MRRSNSKRRIQPREENTGDRADRAKCEPGDQILPFPAYRIHFVCTLHFPFAFNPVVFTEEGLARAKMTHIDATFTRRSA